MPFSVGRCPATSILKKKKTPKVVPTHNTLSESCVAGCCLLELNIPARPTTHTNKKKLQTCNYANKPFASSILHNSPSELLNKF